MQCECGEEVTGEVCMLCGEVVAGGTAKSPPGGGQPVAELPEVEAVAADGGAAEADGVEPDAADAGPEVAEPPAPVKVAEPAAAEEATAEPPASATPAEPAADTQKDMPKAAPAADSHVEPPKVAPEAGAVDSAEDVHRHERGDGTRRGSLGDYMLDIDGSVRIMDRQGNLIYDIPYDDIKCSIRFGALKIRHPGGPEVKLRGSGCRSWLRAISYQRTPPVWYLTGSEDCEVSYGGTVLGVTPCIVTPPFSWDAFQSGQYELRVSRPGGISQKKTVRAVSGTYSIGCPDGEAAERPVASVDGEALVLNDTRSLVLSDVPCLTDRRGAVVLRMPGASVSVKFMRRGATIYWDQPGLGRLAVNVRCDAGLKYDRLREMLPPAKTEDRPKKRSKKEVAPPAAAPQETAPPARAEPADAGGQAAGAQAPNGPPQAVPKEKRKWWKFGRKPKGSKWNRGTYDGHDLTVTKADLDTRLGRFDGYSFEAVCANLLASMGYKIEKGFNSKSGKMLGETKSDMGVDVLAVGDKGKERVVVQCKHWKAQCGGPDVNKTIGAASVFNGTSVLVICTGGFTSQAHEVATGSAVKVDLWDWDMLRRHLRRHLL